MEASSDTADAMVLIHTLPPGTDGPRAEEAVFRQYNSCVDFTFQERRGHNARKLKRLNAIFERAADRRSGGIREDKLLRILPSGTASKYGIDPDSVKARLQARRDWQEKEKKILSDKAKSSSRRKKGRSGGDSHQDQQVMQEEILNDIGPCPELRVLSRGTFLAMFANEMATFINTMGQNERADRERKTRRIESGSSDNDISSSSIFVGKLSSDEHRKNGQTNLSGENQDRPDWLSFDVLGEMTNNPSAKVSSDVEHQQSSSTPMRQPSAAEANGSADRRRRTSSKSKGGDEKARSRSSRSHRRTGSSGSGGNSRRSGSSVSSGEHERSRRRRKKKSRSSGANPNSSSSRRCRRTGYDYDATDDASVSSLSTMGSFGSGGDGGGLEEQRMNFRRKSVESSSSLSTEDDSPVMLYRSLSTGDQILGGDNSMSPDSYNSNFDGPSPHLASSLSHRRQQINPHSADAAAGGWSSSNHQAERMKDDPFALAGKNDLIFRGERRRKSRNGKTRGVGADDSESIGGGRLVGRSSSKDEHRALRREHFRRNSKEEGRRSSRSLVEERQPEVRGTQSAEMEQRQMLSDSSQRSPYQCEAINEDDGECQFLDAVASIFRKFVPGLGRNKNAIVAPSRHKSKTQLSHTPGVPVSTPPDHIATGQHRRTVSLSNPGMSAVEFQQYMMHFRTNSVDGGLPVHSGKYTYNIPTAGHQQLHNQFIGILPPTAPLSDTRGVNGASDHISANHNLMSSSSSNPATPQPSSPVDLRASLPATSLGLVQAAELQQYVASTASFSSVSSHSSNGSGPLAGEFVAIH